MNSVKIDGNLGADCEIVYTGSGAAVVKFSIGNSDEQKPDGRGGYESVTSWVNVEYWPKSVDFWREKLVKGASVTVQGQLRVSSWESEGRKHSRAYIRAACGSGEGFPVTVHERVTAQHTASYNSRNENRSSQTFERKPAGNPFETRPAQQQRSERFEDDIPF